MTFNFRIIALFIVSCKLIISSEYDTPNCLYTDNEAAMSEQRCERCHKLAAVNHSRVAAIVEL